MNKVMLALLTGFVAGILLAPRKGSVTRERLNDRADRISDKLAGIFGGGSEENTELEEENLMVPKMSTLI